MEDKKKINAYKLVYIVFGVLVLGLVGFDMFLYDKYNENILFIIHAISIIINYLLTVFLSKLYVYFNEEEDEFGGILICNILNVVPIVNFCVLIFLAIYSVSQIIRYIEDSGKFTFKP